MSSFRVETVRQLLDTGQPALGTWCSLPSIPVVEVVAGVGFDWICVDLQHGHASQADLHAVLRATEAPTLVRIPWNEPAAIMHALDVGAAGVVIPMVHDGAAARAAVDSCRYAPRGTRSWGPMRHGRPPAGANDDVVCIVMIESVAAVEAVDEIVRTPGVDGVLVGPADLSLSAYGELGGDLEAMKTRVAAACSDAGVWAGIACRGPQDAAHAYLLGFRLLLLGWDLTLLENAETDLLNRSREALGHMTKGG
ncbi:MAG: HpcH/HpaI aldolase family protein [Nocardioidaceae bacterium]